MRRERLAAHLEHLARLRIDDQIEIALAVADFDVGQAMPLLRQRQVALREELDARRPDRQLVGARAEQMPFDADDVAEIEQTEQLEIALRERVLLDVDLNARSAVGEHQKIRLAEIADAENAAARRRVDARGFEVGAGLLAVGADEIGDGRGAIESMRIRVDAKLAQLREIGAALLDLFVFRGHSAKSYRTSRPENGPPEVIDEGRLREAFLRVPERRCRTTARPRRCATR